MNREELHIARIKFKNRILSSNGQAFEDLFIRIMVVSRPGFRPVKPQGRFGDKKNDGFIKDTGTYFQCYSPENLDSKENETIVKLNEAIVELIEFWKSISPVKDFFYVLNDKYQGVYPSIEAELAKIEATYNIKANPFISKDIEDEFLHLPDLEIVDILGGFLPDYTKICNIEISSINEVVSFLTTMPYTKPKDYFPEDLNFLHKIKFNRLSDYYASLLTTASHSDFLLKEYFSYNSSFIKEDLKNIFSEIYHEGLANIDDSNTDKPDLVFDYILEKATPRNHRSIVNAVLVLMAHYFESCDIFEEPKEEEQIKLF